MKTRLPFDFIGVRIHRHGMISARHEFAEENPGEVRGWRETPTTANRSRSRKSCTCCRVVISESFVPITRAGEAGLRVSFRQGMLV
jgi:hypothetical protein